MAETLTYDPTPADQPEFTEEEQQSLEKGAELSQEQEQLLAGKFKDAEELESAYIELQKKLGSDKNTEEAAESDTETEVKSEEEQKKELNQYLEGGEVNYEEVETVYGDKLGKLFKEGGVDPWAISEEFHKTRGQIPVEMKQSLIDSGLSESSVNSYLAGRAAQEGYDKDGSLNDITQKEVTAIHESVGGEKAYKTLMEWGVNNLSDDYSDAFDDIVNSGNATAVQIAVQGLKAQYEEANGYEGRMLSGKAPKSSGDVFRSQAEVVKAMSDSRYEKDPAYRNDIYEKLERSDIKF